VQAARASKETANKDMCLMFTYCFSLDKDTKRDAQ